MLKDSFWALLGNLIGKGLPFVAGIFVARLLGSESYGEFGLIKSSLISIALFSSFGLGITATKFIAEVVDINQQSAKHIEKNLQHYYSDFKYDFSNSRFDICQPHSCNP